MDDGIYLKELLIDMYLRLEVKCALHLFPITPQNKKIKNAIVIKNPCKTWRGWCYCSVYHVDSSCYAIMIYADAIITFSIFSKLNVLLGCG